MYFGSDNWSGCTPKINEALAKASFGAVPAYGASEIDKRAEARFAEIFERECAVLFVATGTAANSLALALTMKPGGIAIAHQGAHVVEDECGGPEFMMGGGRIETVGGANGRIDPQGLSAKLKNFDPPFLHHGRATALTITQATECGTVYSVEEIGALSEQAKRIGLGVHMDGARFANALVHLDVSPAEMTWKAGVDMVSFGGTKNGCWCAEALVVFDPGKRQEAEYLRKRSGQLFSKSRFIAAQFNAYLDDDNWLTTARHSNGMAARLSAAIQRSASVRLAWESQANEVFMVAGKQTEDRLRQAGAHFYEWHTPDWMVKKPGASEAVYRLVTSFATTDEEVERFASLIA